MSEWLQREWTRNSPWQLLLRPVSWLFCVLSALRRAGYRCGILKTHRLPVPVIVVGNITVGGTGKTPLTIWLVRQLQAKGFLPGIVSRGYLGKQALPVGVTPQSRASEVGDEPVMLAERTQVPVFVGQDRVATSQALLQAHPECDLLVSDDGLQHYRLGRDFEIAVVDGERRFGNEQLLPAGPLRESVSRLSTVNAIVCNGETAERGEFAMRLRPTVFRNLCDPDKAATAADFAGGKLLAVAGIGHPPRFFAQLAQLGLQAETRAFPDHHAFARSDFPAEGIDAVLMTEKDAVKCRAFARPEWWYLEVEAQLDLALLDSIVSTLRK